MDTCIYLLLAAGRGRTPNAHGPTLTCISEAKLVVNRCDFRILKGDTRVFNWAEFAPIACGKRGAWFLCRVRVVEQDETPLG